MLPSIMKGYVNLYSKALRYKAGIQSSDLLNLSQGTYLLR